MATQTPQAGESGSESSRSTDTSSNASLAGIQQYPRHQSVHHDAANTATENMPWDAHLNIVHTTGSNKDKKQLAIGCEIDHIGVTGHQLTTEGTVSIHRELREQFSAARNGKPPLSTKAFCCIVLDIKHHDVVGSGIIPDKFHHKYLRQWMKQALLTCEEATRAYMVEVIAQSYR